MLVNINVCETFAAYETAAIDVIWLSKTRHNRVTYRSKQYIKVYINKGFLMTLFHDMPKFGSG